MVARTVACPEVKRVPMSSSWESQDEVADACPEDRNKNRPGDKGNLCVSSKQ
jgi:hypothetical protein